MRSHRSVVERQIERVELRPFTLESFHRRRQRKERNRRIGSAVVALAVAGVAFGGLLRAFSSGGPVPGNDPASPFVGTWVATDVDGSTQTMVIRAAEGEAVEIVVHDDAASVCSGAPSTMRGTGRLEGDSELVIPSPMLTCDDGSQPEALSGPPLEEQLRNMTFIHDPESDSLSDNFGVVWERVPAEDASTSGGMWPQSSLEEVREAQELADAGDPRYTWQVEPDLEANLDDAEIFARFLREELGWEEFLWNRLAGYEAGDPANNNETFRGLVYVRCAPGQTNPLYPNDAMAGDCAPTIDQFRYETVQINVAQFARRGPEGIWVVTGWQMLPPFQQMTPPSDAEVSELMNAFLEARVAGEGAEEHVPTAAEDIPLLYATTTGAPYERYEFEHVAGPEWPDGGMEFEVRLFAEGGKTVVEHRFRIDRDVPGPVGLDNAGETTENGQPVAELYSILDGEMTFSADSRWGQSFFGPWALWLDDKNEERVHVLGDPLPIETGCRQGPAPTDAEALARVIRSDPDLESTAPVTVRVAGTRALRMDVVAATGASDCGGMLVGPGPGVVMEAGGEQGPVAVHRGHRMRLYLLDLPEGVSARILAIAIVAPEARFESVVEAAAPILDSLEFRTG